MNRLRRVVLINLLAPVAAVAFAFAVSSIALVISDSSPVTAFAQMWSYGTQTNSIISTLNRATPLYISGLAVAIGFKMGLFNIGVDGQYRLAALLAAAGGAAVALPAPLHVLLILAIAMSVGAAWAGIAGVLKVTRGVHEVISTIMLNFIATGLGAYLFANFLREGGDAPVPRTPALPETGRFPSLNPWLQAVGIEAGTGQQLQGFIIVAAILGVLYHFLINRTRFGFDLRASGINANAAEASGVDSRRMILNAMLLSGAVAGLVGIGPLLGFFFQYTLDFPADLGFAGIAVALLGRNHPVGVALGALLFAWLDRASQILDLEGIPKEVVVIIQGAVVLSVVVTYEVAFRIARRQEAQVAAAEKVTPTTEEVVA